MAAPVELVSPKDIRPNPDNPRLIFRTDELAALEQSIAQQGILVPLTIYRDGQKFTLLDGERRWRCARKLGLHKVPAIIQDKPTRLTNIMMMFAIHNARKDWDPLPTALKLEELERVLTRHLSKKPTEAELAAAASLSRGEVRRYRKILSLPTDLKQELLAELRKPRSEQRLTVDHVIEAISGVTQLESRGLIDQNQKNRLIHTTVDKFRDGVLNNTTDPRIFARIARSFERGEIERDVVLGELSKYLRNKKYTIMDVFSNTSESLDFEHGTEQLIYRVVSRIDEIISRRKIVSSTFGQAIEELEERLNRAKGLLR